MAARTHNRKRAMIMIVIALAQKIITAHDEENDDDVDEGVDDGVDDDNGKRALSEGFN